MASVKMIVDLKTYIKDYMTDGSKNDDKDKVKEYSAHFERVKRQAHFDG
jgi:hypothetical protein